MLFHISPSLSQKKEKSESERLLTEQLQAKEWELLQLKTEMETSQGTGSAHRVSILLHVVITQNAVWLSQHIVCVFVSMNRKALLSWIEFFMYDACTFLHNSFWITNKVVF